VWRAGLLLRRLDMTARLASRSRISCRSDSINRTVRISIAAIRLAARRRRRSLRGVPLRLRPVRLGECLFVIEIVVSRDIAGLLRPLKLVMILADDALLNHLTTAGIDRMGDVGIQLRPAVLVFDGSIFLQPQPALIAISGLQVVLAAALGAVGRQLSAGHRHERTVSPFDNLEITDHEAIVKGD